MTAWLPVGAQFESAPRRKKAARKRPESGEETPEQGIRRRIVVYSSYGPDRDDPLHELFIDLRRPG